MFEDGVAPSDMQGTSIAACDAVAARTKAPIHARLRLYWGQHDCPRARESARALLERVEDPGSCTGVRLAVDLEGVEVGECAIIRASRSRLGEIEYAVDALYRGRGVATLLVGELLEIGAWMGLWRVRAFVDVYNVASQKVLHRNSFQPWHAPTNDRSTGQILFACWLG